MTLATDMTYTQASTAWPGPVWCERDGVTVKEDLNISAHWDDGVYVDMTIVWYEITRGKPPVPKVLMFADSWVGFMRLNLHRVLAQLEADSGDGQPTPEDVIAALREEGFAPSEYHNQIVPLDRQSVDDVRRLAYAGNRDAVSELATRVKAAEAALAARAGGGDHGA